MGGPFPPAVEAPLVIAHEILARQHRMLFDPDDRLAEVQLAGLEHRRVVRHSSRSRPTCKTLGPARARGRCCRTRRPSSWSNACFGDEVVGQRPILGRSFLLVGLDFSGMPREIE